MTNLEEAVICLDHFLRTEKIKPSVCSECNKKSANAVDFTEAEKALNLLFNEFKRNDEAYNKLLE